MKCQHKYFLMKNNVFFKTKKNVRSDFVYISVNPLNVWLTRSNPDSSIFCIQSAELSHQVAS